MRLAVKIDVLVGFSRQIKRVVYVPSWDRLFNARRWRCGETHDGGTPSYFLAFYRRRRQRGGAKSSAAVHRAGVGIGLRPFGNWHFLLPA